MTLLLRLSKRQGEIVRRIVGKRRWSVQKWPSGYTAEELGGSHKKKALADTNFDNLMKQVRESIKQGERRSKDPS